MSEAVCYGGKNISLDYGYWRPHADSDIIYECFEKVACNGGYYPENDPPIECGVGYGGILCNQCFDVDGV